MVTKEVVLEHVVVERLGCDDDGAVERATRERPSLLVHFCCRGFAALGETGGADNFAVAGYFMMTWVGEDGKHDGTDEEER